jgi:hypothetical protein
VTEAAGFERKILYSVAEVAEITGCPPGRVRRWIYRRQLEAVGLEEVPLVPLPALLARLERLEALRARRRAIRAARRAATANRPPADHSGDPAPSA